MDEPGQVAARFSAQPHELRWTCDSEPCWLFKFKSSLSSIINPLIVAPRLEPQSSLTLCTWENGSAFEGTERFLESILFKSLCTPSNSFSRCLHRSSSETHRMQNLLASDLMIVLYMAPIHCTRYLARATRFSDELDERGFHGDVCKKTCGSSTFEQLPLAPTKGTIGPCTPIHWTM